MNFSQQWDAVYRGQGHLSIWPWSDVVALVHRHAHPRDGYSRVLEVGCGAGANIRLFLKLDADYYGIDGSQSIIAALQREFPELSAKLVVGDFTNDIPFPGSFDLVVDRGAITHNGTSAIRAALTLAYERLRPGGKLIGVDWFSTAYPESAHGEMVDSHTRTNIPSGHLAGLGAVHFSDRDHLVGLLQGAGFELERLTHKTADTYVPEMGVQGWWSFVAVKP